MRKTAYVNSYVTWQGYPVFFRDNDDRFFNTIGREDGFGRTPSKLRWLSSAVSTRFGLSNMYENVE